MKVSPLISEWCINNATSLHELHERAFSAATMVLPFLCTNVVVVTEFLKLFFCVKAFGILLHGAYPHRHGQFFNSIAFVGAAHRRYVIIVTA
jgi:hypothetical protein